MAKNEYLSISYCLSHGELHDGVDNVLIISLEGSSGGGARATGLGDDEVNVLGVKVGLVHGLVRGSGGGGGGRLGGLGAGDAELLGGLGGGLSTEVLSLGLTEDDVGLAAGGLEHVGVGDSKNNSLGLLEGHALDAGDSLEAELGDGLSGLLLAAAVNLAIL